MTTKAFKHSIIGIDPGTSVTGYAIISNQEKQSEIITVGTISLQKIKDPHEKLRVIFNRLFHIISDFKPHYMAIEAPFYGKNVQSMLKLGRAQGVALTCGMVKGLEITEYAPKKIKQSVTGNGNASKEQIAAMLAQFYNTDLSNLSLDATDAIAVAYTHYLQVQNPSLLQSGKYSGWDDFLKNNPDRTI
jgi:crossover junction endodeoxyribonuclease RuvC